MAPTLNLLEVIILVDSKLFSAPALGKLGLLPDRAFNILTIEFSQSGSNFRMLINSLLSLVQRNAMIGSNDSIRQDFATELERCMAEIQRSPAHMHRRERFCGLARWQTRSSSRSFRCKLCQWRWPRVTWPSRLLSDNFVSETKLCYTA